MQYPVFVDESTVTGDGTVIHPLTASGGGGGVPGGQDTSVQFNDSGAFGGDNVFEYFKEDLTQNNFFSLLTPSLTKINGGFFISCLGGVPTTGLIEVSDGTIDALLDFGNSTPGTFLISNIGTGFIIDIEGGNSGDQDIILSTPTGIRIFNQESVSNSGINIFANDSDGSATIILHTATAASDNASIELSSAGGVEIQSTFADVSLHTGGVVRIGNGGGSVAINPGTFNLSFFGITQAPVQTVTGVKADPVAASLVAALAAYGLIIDGTT
jgi:hypothetical protein